MTQCSLQRKHQCKKRTSKHIALLTPTENFGGYSFISGLEFVSRTVLILSLDLQGCSSKMKTQPKRVNGSNVKYESAGLYLTLQLVLGLCSGQAQHKLKRLLYH